MADVLSTNYVRVYYYTTYNITLDYEYLYI